MDVDADFLLDGVEAFSSLLEMTHREIIEATNFTEPDMVFLDKVTEAWQNIGAGLSAPMRLKMSRALPDGRKVRMCLELTVEDEE